MYACRSIRAMVAVVASALTMRFTAASSAQVTGLEADAWTETYGAWKVHVMDVFATCTNETDRVMMVWDTTILMPGPPFHTANDPQMATPEWLCPDAIPSVAADTFVTLGGDQCDNPTAALWFTPDWDMSLLTTSGTAVSPGGWFLVSQYCENNAAGPDLRVRLARLAILDEHWTPGCSVYCAWTIANETCPDPNCMSYPYFGATFVYPDDAPSTPSIDLLGAAGDNCFNGHVIPGENEFICPPPVPFGQLGSSELLFMTPEGWITGLEMEGLAVVDSSALDALLPPMLAPSAAGDFDGDGDRDILLRVPGIGGVWIWTMEDGFIDQVKWIGSAPGASFRILAIADANADGIADVIWRNEVENRQVRVWIMNGDTITSSHQIGVSAVLEFLGVGEVNGDGRVDILWRALNGTVIVWKLNGQFPPAVTNLGNTGVVPATWTPVGMADVNGDGYGDLFWRNSTNGNINGWMLKNTAKIAGGLVAPAVASWWRFAMSADLDDDGDEDVVWRNVETGQINGWIMQGLTRQAGGIITVPSSIWEPIP